MESFIENIYLSTKDVIKMKKSLLNVEPLPRNARPSEYRFEAAIPIETTFRTYDNVSDNYHAWNKYRTITYPSKCRKDSIVCLERYIKKKYISKIRETDKRLLGKIK